MHNGLRKEFRLSLPLVIVVIVITAIYEPRTLWAQVIITPIVLMALVDYFQPRRAIRRNFPFLGRFRYWLEAIRPEIQQYFIERNQDGRPFSREERSVIYQRAKRMRDTIPFGTQKDVYSVGYEWINHSMAPTHVEASKMRRTIGGPECKQPYSASLLNISAMSFGSLSRSAVRALNGGAKDGSFAHNTGEGGVSPYHKESGGDLIWQIGTGYFGCRTKTGSFCPDSFAETTNLESIKMVELKVSQGAKPAHGGILPGTKVTPEVAKIRGVEVGKTVNSPPNHSEFSTPIEMLEFVQKLRELAHGKPIGLKMCIGKRREFLAVCKAMHQTGIKPDYIAIDGGEGGTGAAPLEFSNSIGAPGVESIIFVHNSLVGFGMRKDIHLIATGKIASAFGILKVLALGADSAYSARAMMMALGCIQALRCNSNDCPTGVATQNPYLEEGLVVTDKRKRVAAYHKLTIDAFAHLLGAMGLNCPTELRPWHILRRVEPNLTKHYGELYSYVKDGSFLGDDIPTDYKRAFNAASADSFSHASPD